MSKSIRDMTAGKPLRLIVLFALPLMLGNMFQQLYTMTDAAIVGQYAGVDALAALGSCDWMCWLIFGVITGFTQGFSILVAQRFGAGDMPGMRRAAATLILLSAGAAALFTAVGLIFAAPMLRWMGTQKRVFDLAARYLRILFGGIAVTTAYNMLSAILRALGNSRAPLVAMACAAIFNCGLDWFFVVRLDWGVTGAAAATVMAQAVAATICLAAIRRMEILRYGGGEFRFDAKDASTLLRLAAPMAFQNVLISAGGMALQKVINSLGFIYVAGFTAANKLYGLLEAAAISFGYAVTTYAGQNLGAGRLDRIREGVKSAILLSLWVSLALTGAMFLAGEKCLSLFIESSAEAGVMMVAKRYLLTMSATLSILYFLYVYRSALQGMGDTVMPMASGLAECVMRVGVAWLLTALVGASGIYYAESAAWLGATVILACAYHVRRRRLSAQLEAGHEASETICRT